MAKRQREYIDKNHEVMDDYCDLCEKYCDGGNTKVIKKRQSKAAY